MLLRTWKELPKPLRRTVQLILKAGLTVGAFYLLLSHGVTDEAGVTKPIYAIITEHLATIELSTFLPWLLAATLLKAVGIACSMLRWHLLLMGQGIRFNFGHVVGSFLIGRFLGTFLPSTVGLDGYKLYDAAKFSERTVEATAATVVEKVMGLSGIFLTFLVTFPLGAQILGEHTAMVGMLTLPIAFAVVGGLFGLLFKPGWVSWCLRLIPGFVRVRVESFVERASRAAMAYRGRASLLATCIGLSFLVHFLTAAMYYFTAVSVGAISADFWEVSFASSIQIFATVISPLTIAGEGIREIVQAMLLAKHIGMSQSILSAALGFWAAEALTLVGGVFWWVRRQGYQPKVMELSDPQSADSEQTSEPTMKVAQSSC